MQNNLEYDKPLVSSQGQYEYQHMVSYNGKDLLLQVQEPAERTKASRVIIS